MIGLLAALCLGHGATSTTPPPTNDPNAKPTPPPDDTPDPSTPGRRPGGRGGPSTPPPKGPSPPSGPSAPAGRGSGRTPATETRGPAEWQMWWERNREYVVKMRSLLRRSTATTGSRKVGPRDPMKEQRAEILVTLRRLAREAQHRSLRASAVMALGRMGGNEDALFFLRVLQENKEATGVLEAAAVALGILPPLEGPAREQARAFLKETIQGPRGLPTRARGLTILAAGLRGRHDADVVLALQARGSGRKPKSDETANLIYALGLSGHPLVVPEVISAARDGTFARRGLSDLQRAHAVQALALVEAPHRVRMLTTVLRSRRAHIQTRRSAAMALARLLREGDPTPDDREAARRALLRTLRDGHDITLRGYVALAMGGARPPCGIAALKTLAQSDPEVRLRPYGLLALGLAARDTDDASIRKFLTKRLVDVGESEQVASTSIALGLARAHEATDLLLTRLRRNGTELVRGAAAQGLGLMESRSAHVMQTLLKLAHEERKKIRLLEDVALALGFSGRRDIALKLVDMLRQTESSIVQGRIILALGRLDHGGAIEPLHKILMDTRERTIVREFASVALALMGDRRADDVLFDLDPYFNLYATTGATHELMRLY